MCFQWVSARLCAVSPTFRAAFGSFFGANCTRIDLETRPIVPDPSVLQVDFPGLDQGIAKRSGLAWRAAEHAGQHPIDVRDRGVMLVDRVDNPQVCRLLLKGQFRCAEIPCGGVHLVEAAHFPHLRFLAIIRRIFRTVLPCSICVRILDGLTVLLPVASRTLTINADSGLHHSLTGASSAGHSISGGVMRPPSGRRHGKRQAERQMIAGQQ